MTARINYMAQAPELFNKFVDFGMAAGKGSVEKTIKHLLDIRASQINGCSFCLDMHIKQAKLAGERELRLHHVAVWRESTLFNPRERAALAWTEALTILGTHGVTDAVYDEARAQFGESELVELSYLIMVINAWNRINVAFRTEPGSADKAFGLDRSGLV